MWQYVTSTVTFGTLKAGVADVMTPSSGGRICDNEIQLTSAILKKSDRHVELERDS